MWGAKFMAKPSKDKRREKKKMLQRRAKEQARQSRLERVGLMLEKLCAGALPEYVDDSVSPDLVGRKILWQLGMIAWNIVVTGRDELHSGSFVGSKLNDEQRNMLRTEIRGLVVKMRDLFPDATVSIRDVSAVIKGGVPHAKVQLGGEFPKSPEVAQERRADVIPTGSAVLALRKRLKMTQISFGEKIGVSARKVSAWEHDRSRPNETEAAKIRELASAATDHKGSQ